MKLGVFTVLFGDRPFEAALDRILAAGLNCVEIGTGNYPGDAHCRPAELLADSAALKIFQHTIASRGLEISALSCHGNPLHPRAEVARANHEVFLRTVKLAQQLAADESQRGQWRARRSGLARGGSRALSDRRTDVGQRDAADVHA